MLILILIVNCRRGNIMIILCMVVTSWNRIVVFILRVVAICRREGAIFILSFMVIYWCRNVVFTLEFNTR